MELVSRLQQGERMTDVCREFGISRKTGHKIWNRYRELGAVGLDDQSRAPKSSPQRVSREVEAAILAARKEHPSWGAKKLKEVLERGAGRPFPAASTIGDVLRRNGFIVREKQRRLYVSRPTGLREALAENDVWCADYKGQFRLGDGSYCYPLTVTDQFSRYLLTCEGMGAINEDHAKAAFEAAFREHGLPTAVRTDNGVPFATTGLAGLSKLTVYWMLLGIEHERIRPAHPEENGRHERMHRTLKAETTRPASERLLQQQERFDAFRRTFNHKRPHEALAMKRPGDLYRPSPRFYPKAMPEPSYPLHDDTLYVSRKGFLRVPGRGSVYISAALANQPLGIREENDGRWLVSFMTLDLGHIDRSRTLVPMAPPLRAQ